MKKSTSALAGFAVVAGIVGGTTAAAQAHPAHSSNAVSHHTSSVALSRLQTMLGTSGVAAVRAPLPNDGGTMGH